MVRGWAARRGSAGTTTAIAPREADGIVIAPMPQGADRRAPPVHIVVAAWLYVTLMMALTLSSVWAGIAFFACIGLAPVVVLALLAARRHRARRDRTSVGEEQVHAADDRDTQSDQ